MQARLFLAHRGQVRTLLRLALRQRHHALPECAGHRVEAGTQAADLVAGVDRHLDVEVASGHALAGCGQPRQVARDGKRNQGQREAGHQQGHGAVQQAARDQFAARLAQPRRGQAEVEPADGLAADDDRHRQVQRRVGAVEVELAIELASVARGQRLGGVPARGGDLPVAVVPEHQVVDRTLGPHQVQRVLQRRVVALGHGRGDDLVEQGDDLVDLVGHALGQRALQQA